MGVKKNLLFVWSLKVNYRIYKGLEYGVCDFKDVGQETTTKKLGLWSLTKGLITPN